MPKRSSWDIWGVQQGLCSHSGKLVVKPSEAGEWPSTFPVWPSFAFLALSIWSSYGPCIWRALSARGCVHYQGQVVKPQANSALCRGHRDGRGWQPHYFHILPSWLLGEWRWDIGGPGTQGWECNSVRTTVIIGKVKCKPDKIKECGWGSCGMCCDNLLMLTRWLSPSLSGWWWWQFSSLPAWPDR